MFETVVSNSAQEQIDCDTLSRKWELLPHCDLVKLASHTVGGWRVTTIFSFELKDDEASNLAFEFDMWITTELGMKLHWNGNPVHEGEPEKIGLQGVVELWCIQNFAFEPNLIVLLMHWIGLGFLLKLF